MNAGFFQILFLSIFFMILILINASEHIAFSMMIVLIMMISFTLYLENIHDDLEHHLFRLMLVSVMALRLYIVLISKLTFFLPVLLLSIICACILCFCYAHENIVKMISIVAAIFALLCFTLSDDYGQPRSRMITSNLDKLKAYLNAERYTSEF